VGLDAEHRAVVSHAADRALIEEIVVTDSPLVHGRDELATPVDQLRRDDIIQNLGTTLGETLRSIPGVTNSGFSAGASRPVIRGQDAFRTDVLESGLSTQDVSRLSPDHAVPVNPLAAQSIEVIRGPATLRYGGGASAGVVNAITNRVPKRTSDTLATGEAVGIYGSNADAGNSAALLDGGAPLAGGLGEIGWHLDGVYWRSDDYENGAGDIQEGTFTEGWTASPGIAYFFDEGRLGFSYTGVDSRYGIPEDEPVSIDMRTDRWRFEGDLDEPSRGLRSLEVRGVYSSYRHDEIAEGEIGQTFHNDEFDGRLEALHESLFGFIGALGLHGKTQKLEAGGEAEEFLAPSETTTAALYLFEERNLTDALHAELGLRVEGVWVEGTPIDGAERTRSFAPISGSFALVGHSSDAWTIGATASASQRAPSQVELYARGPHEATGTFEIGDPDFEEETSYSGELRIKGELDPLRVELAGFTTYYDDFIYGEVTGVRVDEEGIPDPSGDLDQLFYRSRSTIFAGGEATAAADLWQQWGGVFGTAAQIDYVRARFTSGDGDRDVPRITPLRWGAEVYYEHDRFDGRFGFLRTEDQQHTSRDEFATDSFTMLHLSARYRLAMLRDLGQLELGLSARNLLDEEARNAVSFNKGDVLLPGRDVRVSLRIQF
jgi:iron complex outermembrane recepter protein